MSETEATATEEKVITLADWQDKVPRIFAACVDEESCGPANYDLSRPFVVGWNLYASDGRIVIRKLIPEDWDLPNAEKIVKNIDEIFSKNASFDTNPFALPVMTTYPRCMGSKTLPHRTCDYCEGVGEIKGDCDCKTCTCVTKCWVCKGDKILPAGECDLCDGTGVGNPDSAIDLTNNYSIQRRFAALLRDHGALVYLPTEINFLDPGPLRFTVDGCEGRLMPMKPNP